MWIIVSWLYRLYAWMVWLAWKCRGETSCAYLVDVNGNQLPLTEYFLETGDFPMTLLIIFYTKQGVRYRFVDIGNVDLASVEETLSSCRTWSAPDYKIFGLMVRIKDHEHVMDPSEFAVVGNKWFTRVFNRWLCKNYLNVPVSDEIEGIIINSEMNMETLSTPVVIHEDALQVFEELKDNPSSEELTEESTEESEKSSTEESDKSYEKPTFTEPLSTLSDALSEAPFEAN